MEGAPDRRIERDWGANWWHLSPDGLPLDLRAQQCRRFRGRGECPHGGHQGRGGCPGEALEVELRALSQAWASAEAYAALAGGAEAAARAAEAGCSRAPILELAAGAVHLRRPDRAALVRRLRGRGEHDLEHRYSIYKEAAALRDPDFLALSLEGPAAGDRPVFSAPAELAGVLHCALAFEHLEAVVAGRAPHAERALGNLAWAVRQTPELCPAYLPAFYGAQLARNPPPAGALEALGLPSLELFAAATGRGLGPENRGALRAVRAALEGRGLEGAARALAAVERWSAPRQAWVAAAARAPRR